MTRNNPDDRVTLLDALLDAAVEAIIVIDEQGAVTLFNRGAEKLLGHTEADVIGRNVNMLMPEPFQSAHDGYIHNYRQSNKAKIIGIGREVLALHANGTEIPVHLSVGEARLDSGRFFVGILHDQSQRAQLETELSSQRKQVSGLERTLAHVHRTSMLGEMAAGIAHEINQPLAAISSYADGGRRLLAASDSANADLIYALEKIGEQARRAGGVIQRMRGLARRQEPPKDYHDLNQVIADLIELAQLEAHESEAPIELQLAETLPQVKMDPIQIQQVVLNLVRNGLEAMVKRSQAALGLIIVTEQSAEQVQVAVVDHGVGVPKDKQQRVFEPFQTTKPTGMGIGLSICATIVRQHGGKIWCEDNPAGGSRFVFTLPIEESQ